MRMPHALLEALARYPLSGGERRVLDVILRFTYGWHRPCRRMRQTLFVRCTGLHPRYVHRVLLSLEAHNVIVRDHRTRPHTYRVNDAFLTWRHWPQTAEPDEKDAWPDDDCELSDDPGQLSRCSPAPWGRLVKDKKDKELPARPAGGVDNTPPHVQALVEQVTIALSPTRAPEARS